jgi:hypothetical protein
LSVAIIIAGSALAPSPAGADPGSYPYCPPKENADCFLLNQVNQKVFPILPGQEGPVIANARAACDFMAADASGSNPLLDYGVWFTRQPGGDALSVDRAADFAMYAARAYCPRALP